MPFYDYRCNTCQRRSTLFYKTYKEYDAATPTCPHCGSTNLTRLISRVAIAKPTQDYSKMDSSQMLSVLEGGDPREVGQMFQQVGADDAANDPIFREATERLIKGDAPDKIEADLGTGSPPRLTNDG